MRYPTQKFRQRILEADKVTFVFRGRELKKLANQVQVFPPDLVAALVVAASNVRVQDGEAK